ncbi:MAG TPA: glycosyltransferase [Methanomassiliicoccales archaeon]|jgi:glycosyltransferase involved in cell wall biosynthesis
MTKILYMIACLRTGGSEAYLLNLVKSINKEHYQVTVWCEGEWGPAGDELRKAGATVIQRRLRPRPGEVLGAIRFLRRERFDLVHSLKYGPTYIDPLVVKLCRIKVFIGSRRNLPHWVNSTQYLTADKIRNRLTDYIIANSEAVKDLTVSVERFPANKITVIYNGVDLKQIDSVTIESGQDYRKLIGIPTEAVVIGNVADFRDTKGQSYLIQAFADLVRRTDKNVYLVIQGEGPEEPNLRALVKELGLEEHVRINTTKQKRLEVIRSFQVFVMPSLSERFPNALVETMALSLPCVGTDVGGIPEVIVNNVTGIIVPAKSVEPLADAILRIIEDPALAKDFGVKGREQVEKKFTAEQMGPAHESVYEELLKK